MSGWKKTSPGIESAIAKSVNFELTIADLAKRSEKRAWRVAFCAMLVALILAGSYFYVLPLKEKVPYLVMADAYEAVLAFQQANGLKADGIVGAHTLDALKKAEQAPLLSNPAHPDYFLYKQALAGVGKLPFSTFKDEQERQNAAASLAVDAKVSGLKQINHVLVSTHGLGLFAVQGRIDDPAHDRVHVDKAQAATQPIERSTQQMDDERRNQQSQQQSRIENETRRMTV